MKNSKFSKMSSAELETYQSRTQDECEELSKEKEFRDWCKEHEEDFESEEARECYKEATGESFWDDLDDDEREGWEHNMTKDSE
jgi:hypothetical protein